MAACCRRRAGPEAPYRAITATRYNFSPRDIQVRAGEPALLVTTSTDFAHGFLTYEYFVMPKQSRTPS
jgi:hypothetical protein